MTTPTIFSDKADNPLFGKLVPQGVLSQQATATIPGGTPVGTNIGMFRIQAGCTVLSIHISVDDLDTGSNVEMNCGYLYDNTTGESDNGYIDGFNQAQAGGNFTWPFAGGINVGTTPKLTDNGYISLTIVNGATDTTGNVTITMQYTYDN